MPNKVKMKLNRKYRLASTLGHVIIFQKGEEVDVPDVLVREAVDIGAEFVDEKARDEVFKEPEEDAQPVNPAERRDDIAAAVEKIIDRNSRDDFTATGNPKLKAVSDEVGYKIDKGELAQVLKARNEDQ